jgi:hypothetical protein
MATPGRQTNIISAKSAILVISLACLFEQNQSYQLIHPKQASVLLIFLARKFT